MTHGLGDLTGTAHDLVAGGDLAGAQELLDEVLSTADPSPAHATPELAEAAGLHARVLVALGDPHAARGWAAFAYAATTRLHGASDLRTVNAAATLAAALHRVGNRDRAARLYRDVIMELTAIEGPESLRVLAAHADLATVEYARGECEVARIRLTDAWELHREVYGDGHPSGIKMLARLAGMERDCGRFTEAHRDFALAQELCRRHLAPDDPLAYQVDSLARAAADPDHVCSAEAPVAPDQPVAPRAAADMTWPIDRTAATEPDPRATQTWLAGDQAPDEIPDADDEPDVDYWATPQHLMPTAPPDPRGRWWSSVDAPPQEVAAYPAPPYDPAPPYGTVTPPWYRPTHPDDAVAAGVYPVPNLPERQQSERLPSPVYHPPPRPARRTLPIVAIGVLVVLLGTVAVITGFGLGGGSPDPGATSAPSGASASRSAPTRATAPATSRAPATPASSGTPPSSLRLKDSADSVTLTWTYPAGVEGPVVIAGGRRGQQPQAFQDLPAGSNTFTVYGLNKNLDYCFTVGVVYSADLVGTSRPVCTNRKRSSTG